MILVDAILHVGQSIFHHSINAVAYVTSEILNHPSVQEAIASSICLGMKKMCYDPELDKMAQHASDTLSKNLDREARRAGQEFPKAVGNFVKGMIRLKSDIKDNKDNTTDDDDDDLISRGSTTIHNSDSKISLQDPPEASDDDNHDRESTHKDDQSLGQTLEKL